MPSKSAGVTIETSRAGWQKQVGAAMKAGQPFRLITADHEWRPNSDNPLDVAKWIWGNALPGKVVRLLTSRGVALGSTAYNRSATTRPPDSVPLDAGEKLAIAGAGGLMLVGAGMILLAFFDPEPTTKLGLLVGGGIAVILSGGLILVTILITRKRYEWTMEVDPKTGKVIWTARPC